MIFGFVLWEICLFLWRVQNLPEKWQILDWSRVTLIERSSSWKHVYKCLRYLSLVLRWSRSMTRYEYKAILIVECILHIFGTQIGRSRSNSRWSWRLSSSDYWKSFGRKKKNLNKKKENDLKKESRLLIKLSPSLGSIN